jgi:hypothetical protein
VCDFADGHALFQALHDLANLFGTEKPDEAGNVWRIPRQRRARIL